MADGAKLKLVRGDVPQVYPAPTIRPTRIARPNTPTKALAEISRLYRDARIGNLPTDEASRLAYILKATSDLVDRALIEPRLDALEKRIASLTELLERRR
jgi:hypothetical protein